MRDQKLIAYLADSIGLSYEVITGPKRVRHIVQSRNLIMRLLKQEKGYGVSRIALLFSRHHSTVIHSLQSIENDLELIPKLSHTYSHLKVKLSEYQANHPDWIHHDILRAATIVQW